MKFELTSKDFVSLLLIVAVLVFVLEANVTIKSPITFGDEGYHGGLSRWIAENKEYPKWYPLGYTEVYKSSYSRPPLYHIMNAGLLLLTGGLELTLKIIPPLIGALVVLSFYLLVKRLYQKEIGLISSLILIGIPSFVTYAVLVFDEMLFIFYMLLFFLTFLIAVKETNKKYWMLSAVFAGLAVLTKNAGMVVFAFLPLAFLYIALKERKLLYNLKWFASFLIIFGLVTSPFFIRNFALYNAPTCYGIPFEIIDQSGCSVRDFTERFEFETRSLAGGTENSIARIGLVNYVNFAYGNHWFILLGAIGGFIFLVKSSGEKIGSLIVIMMLVGIYSLYATFYRAEDAARQLLFWSALIILVSAIYWEHMYKFLQKYHKHLGLIIVAAIIFLSYQNITSKLATMENVKRFSPAFFEACGWVKENLPNDAMVMTVWNHRAAYSCERDISPAWADIRLNDDPVDIVNVADMHGITHFFIQKFSITQQPSGESYSISFVALLEDNPDKFEKVFENGPALDQCLQQGGCDGNIIYKVVY